MTRLQARFEELLVLPLETTSALRRQVKAHLAPERPEGSPEAQAFSVALVHLLESLPRKTSPLHLRMTHALARLYLEGHSATNSAELTELLDDIAHRIRRPDLKVRV